MDRLGRIYGVAKSVSNLDSSSPAILFLRAGSNIVPDFFFVRKAAFKNVFSNYITWNIPYWLKFEERQVNILRLKKVEPWYKYRVYSENYVLSDAGKFETANGCLRTIIEIGQRLEVPFLKLQSFLVRILKTPIRLYFKHKPCPLKHIREMIKHVVDRYYEKVPQDKYWEGLLGFYANFPSNRAINLQFTEKDEIYLGKDSKIFYYLMKKLPPKNLRIRSKRGSPRFWKGNC
jgi:hypothetical protein